MEGIHDSRTTLSENWLNRYSRCKHRVTNAYQNNLIRYYRHYIAFDFTTEYFQSVMINICEED